MTGNLLAGLTLLGLVVVSGGTTTANCSIAGTTQASSCTTQHMRSDEYLKLVTLIDDAIRYEINSFLVNVTLEIYMFLHPCAQAAEGILYLLHLSPPDPSSDWWNTAAALFQQGPASSGKREVILENERELLQKLLRELVTSTNYGCVAALLNQYRGEAGSAFNKLYPAFSTPPTVPPTTTTPTTTTTTAPPTTPTTTERPTTPTTTERPTTPTTTERTTTPTTTKRTMPTTTKRTTHTTTERPTTPTTTERPTTKSATTERPTTPQASTTTATTTTYAPLECYVCKDLDCLLNSASQSVQVCARGESLCMTTVTDGPLTRSIERSCATKSECDGIHNANTYGDCNDIDNIPKHQGLECKYCCRGNQCNRGPEIVPHHLYSSHSGSGRR